MQLRHRVQEAVTCIGSQPQFYSSLYSWWDRNARAFPWRDTSDPYEILVAEFMLHRTRASQVLRVYGAFLDHFPTIEVLAAGRVEEVCRVMRPLGLTWRARALHETAKHICDRFHGAVPRDYEILTNLPGIDHYIASAVRCISWGEPDPLIDSNVIRIIARLTGVELREHVRRSKWLHDALANLIDTNKPKSYNLAMIDLGASVCISGPAPRCHVCPVSAYCSYYAQLGRYEQLSDNDNPRVGEA